MTIRKVRKQSNGQRYTTYWMECDVIYIEKIKGLRHYETIVMNSKIEVESIGLALGWWSNKIRHLCPAHNDINNEDDS